MKNPMLLRKELGVAGVLMGEQMQVYTDFMHQGISHVFELLLPCKQVEAQSWAAKHCKNDKQAYDNYG